MLFSSPEHARSSLPSPRQHALNLIVTGSVCVVCVIAQWWDVLLATYVSMAILLFVAVFLTMNDSRTIRSIATSALVAVLVAATWPILAVGQQLAYAIVRLFHLLPPESTP